MLSLFDGMSCGQIALQKAKIEYDFYYASEIDKNAIKITQTNFPNTIQIGDVNNVNGNDFKNINLLIGGSPCQGFSVNGNKLNFEDKRSRLIFEYIRIRDETNPKFWLLENVATMTSNIKTMIDDYVGVKGVIINSNYFSAQNRKRVYWTNIPFNFEKSISNLIVRNILENNVCKNRYWSDDKIAKQNINPTITDQVITLNPKMFSGKQTYQQDRIYDCNGKFVALTATLGDRFNILDDKHKIRRLTIREQARLQTIPDDYNFDCINKVAASKVIGNGWTVDLITHILEHINKI